MAEAAFSEDGKYFSLITNDGRLRIWDTETNVLKQEYTPDFHLKASPTCLQWVEVNYSLSPKKGRKSISGQTSQCVALGTIYGKILLYSVSQAKVETVLENEKQTKKIQSLDWHRKYGLFSCSVDSHVIEWDLGMSSVKHTYNVSMRTKLKQVNKASGIKIVPHNQDSSIKYIIVASVKTNIWRLENSNATIVQSLSHTVSDKAILTVTTLRNSCWLIEGSQEERLLSFWDVTIKEEPLQNGDSTPSNKKRKKEILVTPTPTYNFVLEDAPKFVDVNIKSEGEGTKLSLVAATRSGVVHYYGHMLNGSTTKPIKPSVTIQVSTPDASPLPLTCCQLPNNGDLLLGYKNGPVLFFEKVTPDLSTKTQILIRGDNEKKVQKSNETTKDISSTNNDITYVEPMGGVSRKRPTAGSTTEVTMEARLQNLALDLNSRSKAPVNQNLTKLLMQGLHSDDKGLILTVLQKDDPAVALNTIASLPAEYVPMLLDSILEMATRKTSQCAAACTWLNALIKSHSALLLASINARTANQITQLLAIFTHRRSHLCQLLNLKGRIDLTVVQRNKTKDVSNQAPILDYQDTSSDEEMEIEKADSSADEQWEDEVDEGDDDDDDDDDDETSDQSED
ncbi:WD repeat-containing protein 43 [Pieris brassicae]|uniref:WD repeat-containing protein 43 n=1 Tax=Pieris brassicae TaxID=7116 RepID=UPI001E661EB0|nr:WD repeat-containing protein 43 [Pieris brassicae]